MPTVSSSSRDRLATPVREFIRPGVITIPEHASLLQAKRATVRHGVHAATGVTHLLVSDPAGGAPYGVVAPIDPVELVTRP
jgi:hypothetical protein